MKHDTSIPIENSRQVTTLVVSGLCIFLTSLVVGLRVLAKLKQSKRFDSSDLCIVIALLFNTALHVDMLIMVVKFGFSFHVGDVETRFGPETLTSFFKAIMAFALLWNVTTCFTKISVLLMYTSLFPVRHMILACRLLGGFVVVWNTAGILAGVLICQPIAMNWDPTINGKCGSRPMYYMGLGIINIIVEATLLALPAHVLYHLQMPLRKKLVVFGMFGIGIATWGVTIYRQCTLSAVDFTDMTDSGLLATLLSGLEPSVALALSCVPFLRPYFVGSFHQPRSEYIGESGDISFKGMGSGHSRRFQELNDDTSEVQLQPMEVNQNGQISAHSISDDDTKRNKSSFILVKRQWEVSSNERQ